MDFSYFLLLPPFGPEARDVGIVHVAPAGRRVGRVAPLEIAVRRALAQPLTFLVAGF